MAFSKEGLKIKRYPQILEELNTRLKDNAGQKVDTSENSLIGHLQSNMALSLSEVWELGQSIYDAQRMYDAEGDALDNLTLLAGVVRIGAKKSYGLVNLTGDDGTLVKEGSTISSIRDDVFYINENTTISATDCLSINLKVAIVADNTIYRIGIDGVIYEILSNPESTHLQILNALEAEIENDGSVNTEVVLDPIDEEESYLRLTKVNQSTTMSVQATTYLSYEKVVTPTLAYSQEYGVVAGDALAITNIIAGTSGWDEVINPSDFTLGSEVEDDEALRFRAMTGYSTVGAGTFDSIGTAVRRVPNVAAAIVKENTSSVTDLDGIPPKSYEVIVHEGNTEEIAQALWRTKPAGIYLHGSTTEETIDYNGYLQTVRFTRPTELYVHIKVSYSPYNEEVIRNDAVDAAKQKMLEYANSYITIDTDVIPTRFIPSIYSATTGFGNVEVSVATTVTPSDTPSKFTTSPIPISDRQIASFALARMTFTQV